MENLPSELLAKVLQELPRYEWPSARLINRTFAAVAEPFVFDTIPLWIEPKSLETLTSISEHPRLAQCVKTIAFSPLRFIDAPRCLDVKVLSHALSKLPKFKSLILDYGFHGRTLRLYQVFGGRGELPDRVKMDGDYSFPILFNALSAAKVAITALTICDTCEVSFCSDDSSMRLPESEVGNIPPTASYGMVSKALAKTFCPPRNFGCRAALRELRHFEVDVGNEDHTDDPFDPGDPRGESNRKFANTIRYILKWSSQIESIRITQTLQNILWLMDLFPTEGLAKLQKVHLCEIQTDLSDLLLFFQRHGRKLKHVHFISVEVEDANWPTALYHLRSLDLPDLKRFSLSDCHDGYYGHKNVDNARDYVTGATDIEPSWDDIPEVIAAPAPKPCSLCGWYVPTRSFVPTPDTSTPSKTTLVRQSSTVAHHHATEQPSSRPRHIQYLLS